MEKDEEKRDAEEEEASAEEETDDDGDEEADADDDDDDAEDDGDADEDDDLEEDDEEDEEEEEEDEDEDDLDEDEDDLDEDEDEEDEDEDEDDEDEDDEDEDEDDEDEDEAPVAKRVKGRAPRRARRRVIKKRGSPTRNIILFVILVGGLAAMFGIFGSTGGGGGPVASVKWKVGQVVNVEVTIVTTDYKNLNCAMQGEMKGYYCAYTAQNKRNTKSKADSRAEENMLQPFTTTDRIQFMGSGLWMTPALKAKLDKENFDRPSPRFTANCKMKVEGRTKTAFAQWKPGEGWNPANGWYVGKVTSCTIQ